MDNPALQGYLQVEIIGAGLTARIPKLFPYQEDGEETTREHVLHALELERVTYGVNTKAIDYWLEVGKLTADTPTNCIVADYTPVTRKGADKLELLVNTDIAPDDRAAWNILERYIDDFTVDAHPPVDFPFVLVHEGQQIAKRTKIFEPVPGKNIHGDAISATRGQNVEYNAGENVYLDEKSGVFTAGVCGYLVIKNYALHVYDAFQVSRDKMQLCFLNLPRTDASDHITEKELYNYAQRNQIDFARFNQVDWSKYEVNDHPVLLEGIPPGESVDASVETFFTIETSIGEMDEHGKIDYKEQHRFNSIDADVLLATKQLAIRGKDGIDIYGTPVQAPMPKDKLFKQGRGIRVEKTDTEMRFYSAEEGVLEFEKDILSVFPQITIRGDVGMETGHIDSKANVEIMGSILAGFNVTSKKNIMVRGSIEDDCVITCGGDLSVHDGISGESTRIFCAGAFTAKFVETCHLEIGGRMQVQRFLRGVNVSCEDSIIVFGHGINLNERGAIVDSDIRVRHELHVPVIGSDAGLTTKIWFGWNKKLCDHIEQLTTTVAGLEKQIAELGADLPVDINNPNVYTEMKNYDRNTKDEIIARIQKKNKMESRIKMMRGILESEITKREEMLKAASVHVSKKIIPSVVLQCHGFQKTIDSVEPPSRYYFDTKSRMIERSAFGVGSSNEEDE